RRFEPQMLAAMLEHGGDGSLRTADGRDALLNAAGNGDADSARVLLEHGADINVRDAEGDTALHIACRNGNAELARLLLEHGADRTARNSAGEQPAQLAQGWKDVEALFSGQ